MFSITTTLYIVITSLNKPHPLNLEYRMLPQLTKRLVKEEAIASYVYREVPLPSLQGDELLVKVGKVALCGTDISLYQWNKGGCGLFSTMS